MNHDAFSRFETMPMPGFQHMAVYEQHVKRDWSQLLTFHWQGTKFL
jgi:hypothetical protein